MSYPGSTLRGMGNVVDLRDWKRRKRPDAQAGPPLELLPADPLEELIARLDRLVRAGGGRLGTRVETELLAIIRAVHAGLLDEAMARGQRLVARLEHPSARVAR